jgi:hypothetical protein
VVRTANGRGTGIDLDRLVFASQAGGAPWPNATGTAGTQASPATVAPTATVAADGDTSIRVEVSGAHPGTPFWLVLGESLSAGWKATVNGRDVGAARLVDGYANGWRITPGAATLTVQLTWTPQRIVRIALGLSAAAVVATLALLLVTTLRRRRAAAPGAPPDGPDAGAGGPDLPIADPLRGAGARVPARLAAPIALAVGLGATVVVNPAAGTVVAMLTLVALVTTRGRLLLRIAPPLCLAGSALYVLEVVGRYSLPSSGSWVANFTRVATLSWLAVLLLTADLVVTAATGRAARRAGTAATGGEPADPVAEPSAANPTAADPTAADPTAADPAAAKPFGPVGPRLPRDG